MFVWRVRMKHMWKKWESRTFKTDILQLHFKDRNSHHCASNWKVLLWKKHLWVKPHVLACVSVAHWSAACIPLEAEKRICKKDRCKSKLGLHLIRMQIQQVVMYAPPFPVFRMRIGWQWRNLQNLLCWGHSRSTLNSSCITQCEKTYSALLIPVVIPLATCMKRKD